LLTAPGAATGAKIGNGDLSKVFGLEKNITQAEMVHYYKLLLTAPGATGRKIDKDDVTGAEKALPKIKKTKDILNAGAEFFQNLLGEKVNYSDVRAAFEAASKDALGYTLTTLLGSDGCSMRENLRYRVERRQKKYMSAGVDEDNEPASVNGSYYDSKGIYY